MGLFDRLKGATSDSNSLDTSSLDNCPYCGSPLAGFQCYSCKVEFEMVGGKLQESGPGSRSNASGGESCEMCQASLANADRYLPYEDGSNSNAYIKCSSCGHDNIRYGFGED